MYLCVAAGACDSDKHCYFRLLCRPIFLHDTQKNKFSAELHQDCCRNVTMVGLTVLSWACLWECDLSSRKALLAVRLTVLSWGFLWRWDLSLSKALLAVMASQHASLCLPEYSLFCTLMGASAQGHGKLHGKLIDSENQATRPAMQATD